MRNPALIGITCVVALCFTLLAHAKTIDTDRDGIIDRDDGCVLLPNGPTLSTGSCDAQEDGDKDGYGNPCDTDYNNNGATDLVDVFDALLAAAAVSTDNTFDNNCNGAADLVDTNLAFMDATVVKVPGPSGLACAGTVPCP